MPEKDRCKKHSPYPPNVSVNYYTDPIYSTDAYYGFEEEEETQTGNAGDGLADDEFRKGHDALDEPIESWGWINNVD